MLTMKKPMPSSNQKSDKVSQVNENVLGGCSGTALKKYEKYRNEKKFLRGESIFREGDQAGYVYFVKVGCVKEVRHSASGRNITLCLLGANKIFGTGSFASGQYASDCIAETDATIISYPTPLFLSMMAECPEMGKAVLEQISQLLHESKDTQVLALESVRKRILKELVILSGQFGNTIPMTRQEFADLVGCTVETAIRAFSKLEMEGLVSLGRAKVMIKNAQHLVDQLDGI